MDRPVPRDQPMHISLSLHCEMAEIMTAYTKHGGGRRASSRRPARLLGRPAAPLRGAGDLDRLLPGARDRLSQHQPAPPELAQGGASGADDGATSSLTSTSGARSPSATCCSTSTPPPAPYAKVNPPIRPREDVEYLWKTLLRRRSSTGCVSDHACCSHELEGLGADDPEQHLGGQVRLRRHRVPALGPAFSEGSEAGPILEPDGRAHRLEPGPALRSPRPRVTSLPGYDADIVLFDPDDELRRAGRGVRILPGLHSLRGHGAHRSESRPPCCAAR